MEEHEEERIHYLRSGTGYGTGSHELSDEFAI